VSDDYQVPPTGVPVEPSGPRRSRGASGGGVVAWLIGAVIVLILAVAGGLFTAWVVANMRAVPGPVGAASPTPTTRATAAPATVPPSSTAGATQGPRHTPTPAPTVEVTPEPFVHVVARGESLSYIASLYGVTVEDVLAINDIANPNRIQVGQEILIPGYGVPPTPRPRG
jgi:LysM repeat protein